MTSYEILFRAWSAVLAALLLILSVTPARAQWVEPAGQGWASLSLFYQDTQEQFGISGETRPLLLEGHAFATSTFLTVALGVVKGVDVWVQPSFHRLRYDDRDGRRISTGFGDARIFVRATPGLLFGSDFPFAIRAGIKVPVSDLDVGNDIIPLGDGQRDYEVVAEVGHSFWPRPLYAAGWVGYRWREATDRGDFGDERFFSATLGGGDGLLGFKVLFEGWFGETPTFGAQPSEDLQRQMLRLSPSLLVQAGPGQIELGTRVPIAGKNLPSGSDFVLGYFTRFGFGGDTPTGD